MLFTRLLTGYRRKERFYTAVFQPMGIYWKRTREKPLRIF
jgi:hypothetical protein